MERVVFEISEENEISVKPWNITEIMKIVCTSCTRHIMTIDTEMIFSFHTIFEDWLSNNLNGDKQCAVLNECTSPFIYR